MLFRTLVLRALRQASAGATVGVGLPLRLSARDAAQSRLLGSAPALLTAASTTTHRTKTTVSRSLFVRRALHGWTTSRIGTPLLHRQPMRFVLLRPVRSLLTGTTSIPTSLSGFRSRLTGLVVNRFGAPRGGLTRIVQRWSSSMYRYNRNPRNWKAIAGLVLVGGFVLWATSGFIKAVLVGLVKIAFYAAVLGVALYTVSRLGSRLWRQAYGTPAPWEGLVRAMRQMVPGRVAMTSASWLARASASVLRIAPAVWRMAANTSATSGQRAAFVTEAATELLQTNAAVRSLLGPGRYDYGRPTELQYVRETVQGTTLERVRLRFTVSGPRATGECVAATSLSPSTVEVSDVLFDQLELVVGPHRLVLTDDASSGTRPRRVIEAEEYEVK